jgi:hypothetical protein
VAMPHLVMFRGRNQGIHREIDYDKYHNNPLNFSVRPRIRPFGPKSSTELTEFQLSVRDAFKSR